MSLCKEVLFVKTSLCKSLRADALFNDCFDKLKTLVRSLGLKTAVEKKELEQLGDWQRKGNNFQPRYGIKM